MNHGPNDAPGSPGQPTEQPAEQPAEQRRSAEASGEPPPRDDRSTTLWQLREVVRQFVDERDWAQFHSPKNLAMSLAIEAAELMEHFQWISTEASRDAADDPQKRNDIGEELCDVLCYALGLANELQLDIATAFRNKMLKNVAKYPALEFRGRYGKDDPGPEAE